MVFMVISLYTLATIYLAFQWSFTQYAFIDHGQTFWWIFVGLQSVTDRAVAFRLVGGITGCASTVIADSSMVYSLPARLDFGLISLPDMALLGCLGTSMVDNSATGTMHHIRNQ